MKYGLIGEKLGHSFSREIHGKIADYEYELREISGDGLDGFMKARDFLGINVTIPYKEAVMPYLDEIDYKAMLIGSVNTIVNNDGKLYGYNTDFYVRNVHHVFKSSLNMFIFFSVSFVFYLIISNSGLHTG